MNYAHGDPRVVTRGGSLGRPGLGG